MRHDIRQLTSLLKEQNFNPTTFIEIGSRDGHDTHYIASYWNLNPNNCYIIEAHPDCYNNIKLAYPFFITFNIAASNETKPITFNAGIFGEEENIGISSVLDRTLSPFKSRQVEVDGWRLDDLMNQINLDKFDFIKVDVEGFGLQVLEGFGDRIKDIKYIQIELEIKQVWEGQSYYDDVVSYLDNKGFIVLDEVVLDNVQKDVIFKNKNL